MRDDMKPASSKHHILEPAWKVLAEKAWRRVQLDEVNRRLRIDPSSVTQEEFVAALHESQRTSRAVKKMDAAERETEVAEL